MTEIRLQDSGKTHSISTLIIKREKTWRSSSKSSAGCGRGAGVLLWCDCAKPDLGCAWSPVSPAMGPGLGRTSSSQNVRCCRTGLSLLCPVPILSLQGFPKVLLLSAFQEDSPQAVKEPREVRTRAKSHILEREPLLCTQVSVLLHRGCSVLAPALLAPAPAAHKQISPPFLVGGWNV